MLDLFYQHYHYTLHSTHFTLYTIQYQGYHSSPKYELFFQFQNYAYQMIQINTISVVMYKTQYRARFHMTGDGILGKVDLMTIIAVVNMADPAAAPLVEEIS